MRKSYFWALAVLAVSTVLTGCEKEDKDAIEMSVVKKGVQIIEVNGKQYEVVDMGFSNKLLWATCNLGADSPEQNGNFYAWGETEPKTNFTIDNYKWMEGRGVYKKYCLRIEEKDIRKDTIDNKKSLDASDDAVKAALGDRWSTPSIDDFKELLERTTFRCCKLNGAWGYLFTCKENGNSIFLPLAGFTDESDNFFIGKRGRYWSSSISSNSTMEAKMFSLDKPTNPVHSRSEERYLGFSIRPVYK